MTADNLSQLDRAMLGLRSMILSGSLVEGQRLSEVKVAEELGMSRTPLRQAMDRLAAEGLLERIPTGGCRVATFSRQDVADAIELRGVLEGTAARMAAERGVDPSLLKKANAALDTIDIALVDIARPNFQLYLQQNALFHDLLAQFPASPVLQREVRRISQLPLASPSAFLSDQALIPDFINSLPYAQRQHRAIIEAIDKREGARAEALSREHARLALSNIETLYNGQLDPEKSTTQLISTASV